jgi:hypothetical protein
LPQRYEGDLCYADGFVSSHKEEASMLGKRSLIFVASVLLLWNWLALDKLAAQADISFTRSDYPVGRQPVSVTVGDFDGDKIQDLAVANGVIDGSPGTTVSILMGNGDGTFKPATEVGAGTAPASIALGDFNGDEYQDLAVANFQSRNVSILLGNGDGSFRTGQTISLESDTAFVAVGDFDEDGIADLAVANFYAHTVTIVLGNGDGTFRLGRRFSVGMVAISLTVADFDGDGHQDLAVANRDSSNVSVLLGMGDGTFRPARNYAAGESPFSITVGDFNGDKLLDLAAANLSADTVSILLGNGDGTFNRAENFRVDRSPSSVTVGDFNGDAIQDLAVATGLNFSRPGNTVSVLLGNGDGTFGPAHNVMVGFFPMFVAVGDFNGDDRPDLAVANAGSGNVSVLINDTP